MKKILVWVLVLSMVMAVMPTAIAAERTEEVEKLLISVKDRIEINDEEFEFEDYYENTYNGRTSYSLSWNSKEENGGNIIVEADADGKITYFYKSDKSDYKVKFLNYSEDEAKAIATEFLKKIEAPEEISEAEVTKSGNTYMVSFDRVHNGINVISNYLRCIVSGDTGEVIRYNLWWNDGLEFEENEAISIEEAKEIYKNELGYELFYTIKNNEENKEARLVYKPKYEETAYIEASTGEIKTYSQFVAEEAAADNAMMSSGGMEKGRLSEKEMELLGELDNLINEEEAEKIAKSIEEFKIDDSYYVSSSNIYKRNDGKYIMSISLETEKEEVTYYKSLSLEAETGKLLGYNSYSSNYSGDKENKISDEEGKSFAEAFIKKHYENENKSLVPYNTLSKRDGYYNYQRTVNGVRVSNNGIRVGVNLKTGELESLSFTWDDVNFPSTEVAQPKDKVYEKLFEDNRFKLSYLIITEDAREEIYKPKAVYNINNTSTLDATTLKEVDSYTLEESEKMEKPVYSDISGHYAEEKIKKLVEYDIYLEGTELMPEKAITKREFMSLVYMAFSGSEPRPLSDLYKSSVAYFGYVEEDDEDEPITRLDAIKMLLDYMGYKEFAAIEGIFNCPFEDIEEKDKGYGAIAAGLKLVSTADSLFYKDADLRRADAFIIIYNYLAA